MNFSHSKCIAISDSLCLTLEQRTSWWVIVVHGDPYKLFRVDLKVRDKGILEGQLIFTKGIEAISFQ